MPVFAKEGYKLIAAAVAIAVILVALGIWAGGIIGWIVAILGILALGFTLYFFRDPERRAPEGAVGGTVVLAPADGKVVLVQDVEHEPLYLKGPARQISIFLSPLNVHVNRNPVDGVVEFEQYVPGDYLVAWHPKASEKNERSQIGVRHDSGARVLYKQIAGAVARRIVYRLSVGDRVVAGERFGIVKFGSRMDVLVPPRSQIDVAVGDRTVAGETLLGRLPTGTIGEPDASQQQAARG